jgi:hypothetical protein
MEYLVWSIYLSRFAATSKSRIAARKCFFGIEGFDVMIVDVDIRRDTIHTAKRARNIGTVWERQHVIRRIVNGPQGWCSICWLESVTICKPLTR